MCNVQLDLSLVTISICYCFVFCFSFLFLTHKKNKIEKLSGMLLCNNKDREKEKDRIKLIPQKKVYTHFDKGMLCVERNVLYVSEDRRNRDT